MAGEIGKSQTLILREQKLGASGKEDPLEEEMATHSSIVWRIPWTEEPGRLWSIGATKSWT